MNPGAESRIGVGRGIQKGNPEEESRRGIQERNPGEEPREESRGGIQERNPGEESTEPGASAAPRPRPPQETAVAAPKNQKNSIFQRKNGARDLQTRLPDLFFSDNERRSKESNFFRERGSGVGAAWGPLTFVRQNPYSQSLFGE